MSIEVLLTKNLPEELPFDPTAFSFPVTVLDNARPKGFAANHNASFNYAKGEWFCVMNPDIRLKENPFPILLEEMARRPTALIAPSVLNSRGQTEDSIRRFPTPLALVFKVFGYDNGQDPLSQREEPFEADWVAGMFMLFRADNYRAIGGFDEGFFLYYEDVDVCARLWKSGERVLACPKAQVVHDAQRTSRHDFQYMRWHLSSMIRYFWKHYGRTLKGAIS